MDPEGKSLEVNSSWVEATGVQSEVGLNMGWIGKVHPNDVAATRTQMQASLENGTPIDLRYRIRNEAGEWTWKRSRGAPRYGPTGEITRWYGIVENLPTVN
jgi:PAS domain S-box-containing protein